MWLCSLVGCWSLVFIWAPTSIAGAAESIYFGLQLGTSQKRTRGICNAVQTLLKGRAGPERHRTTLHIGCLLGRRTTSSRTRMVWCKGTVGNGLDLSETNETHEFRFAALGSRL